MGRGLTIPTLVGGDQTKVLILRLGTFADASTDATLDLVRGTNTLVAFLQLDGHFESFRK
jgi:hypothetical protein